VSLLHWTWTDKMDIYQRNYRKLLELVPTLKDLQPLAMLSTLGSANTEISVLDRNHEKLVLRLTRFRKRVSGETVVDLDMTAAVFLRYEQMEALTYQDCFGYRQVYCDDLLAFSPVAQKELNAILNQWLTCLASQGRFGVVDIAKSVPTPDEGV
jgi:uncharacterized protein YqiB (DUF1249 family)